jgi:hypothetical protein
MICQRPAAYNKWILKKIAGQNKESESLEKGTKESGQKQVHYASTRGRLILENELLHPSHSLISFLARTWPSIS